MSYTLLRFWAMLKKELIVIKRDSLTYFFILIIPFSEVTFFGYIINTNAKHLPTIIVVKDNSQFTNSIVSSLRHTEYFTIKSITDNEEAAEQLLTRGQVIFVITIPENFAKDLIRKRKPHILIEGDGTDPAALSNAFNAASNLPSIALTKELSGPLNYLSQHDNNFIIDTQAKYNPSILSQYHTLPGLLVTILSVALIMLTAISITSEFENGTMEMLLITPIKPLEVIFGKIIPHIVVGYAIFFLTILLTYFVFKVPFYGSVILLALAAFPYLIANLSIGITVSSISKTQFRASNLTNTYILPAIFLSGFVFPFYAMPVWAQWIGNLLPPTYFLRITNKIMLKGAGFFDIWRDIIPIVLFTLVMVLISYKYYRKTLD